MIVIAVVASSLVLQAFLLRPRRARLVARSLLVTLGWLTLLVLADFGVGSLFSRGRGTDELISRQAAVTAAGQIPREPRADSDAFASSPWAEDYLAELQVQRYDYKPFVVGHTADVDGEFITTDDGVRESYRPAGADTDEAVEVWFFGGSTMFGEGQRDQHTIPSAFARRAETEGIIVRPVNFGHQGQLLWQEMLRFEFELARRGPPDAAVFLDGTNDYNYQLVDPGGQPTHGALDLFSSQLSGHAAPLPSLLGPGQRSWWDRYRTTSVLGAVPGMAWSLTAARPAEAGEADPPPAETPELLEHVRAVYVRSMEMTRLVAEAHDVPTTFFWQPIKSFRPGYLAVARALPDDVVDLTGLLVDPPEPVFIDLGSHTNELGAALTADAIYESIRPQLTAGRAGS